jgi:prophage DNA circulation protein
LTDLFVTGGILATDELDNPFRFDGVLITLQQPVSVQFVDNPNVIELEKEVERLANQQENTIIPNQVSIAATTDKTYDKLVSVGNTVDAIYTNTVGINDIVVDTNNRVISIGATTLDIKKNTNLIPALL